MALPCSHSPLLFPEIWITKTTSAGTLLVPYPGPLEPGSPLCCAPPQLLPASLLNTCTCELSSEDCPCPWPAGSTSHTGGESWHWLGVYTCWQPMPMADWQGQGVPAALLWGWSTTETQLTLTGSHREQAATGNLPVTVPVCGTLTFPVLLSLLPYGSSQAALPSSIIYFKILIFNPAPGWPALRESTEVSRFPILTFTFPSSPYNKNSLSKVQVCSWHCSASNLAGRSHYS